MRRVKIFALAALAIVLAPAASISGDAIRVHLIGLSEDVGRVLCGLYNTPDGFPTDRSKVISSTAGPVQDDQGVCTFTGVPPGTYAVAAFQDEHGTGKMTKNWLGIPTEPYGFSNDAMGTVGAPSFDAASFKYDGGILDVTIHAK